MHKVYRNSNNKLWLFWSSGANCNVLEANQQHITCQINHAEFGEKLIITYVDAKFKDHL